MPHEERTADFLKFCQSEIQRGEGPQFQLLAAFFFNNKPWLNRLFHASLSDGEILSKKSPFSKIFIMLLTQCEGKGVQELIQIAVTRLSALSQIQPQDPHRWSGDLRWYTYYEDHCGLKGEVCYHDRAMEAFDILFTLAYLDRVSIFLGLNSNLLEQALSCAALKIPASFLSQIAQVRDTFATSDEGYARDRHIIDRARVHAVLARILQQLAPPPEEQPSVKTDDFLFQDNKRHSMGMAIYASLRKLLKIKPES